MFKRRTIESLIEDIHCAFGEDYKYINNPNLPYKNIHSDIQIQDTSTGIYYLYNATYIIRKAREKRLENNEK